MNDESLVKSAVTVAVKPRTTRVIRDLEDVKALLETCRMDGRTQLSRELANVRREIASGLGGISNCSPQELVMVELISRELVLLDLVDGMVFGKGHVLDRRRRKMHSVIGQRQKLADSLANHLKMVGLRKRGKS